MKRIVTFLLLVITSMPLFAENLIPLSVSWNVVESRWEKTSDSRLLFIMSLNYPSRRLPSLSEEEYMACLHEYTRRHPDSTNTKVVNYLKTNPDLSKSPAVLVVEVALKNNRITSEQAAILMDSDSTPDKVGEILLAIPDTIPMNILDDGSKEYILSDNHTRIISPDGTIQDYITSDDEFYDTLNKFLHAADWIPVKTHMGDGTFVNTVNIRYSDFRIDPERIIGRKFSDSGFIATIIVEGGFLVYRSFDKIGTKMEEAKFLTPSVYKKNGSDDDVYFLAWWLNERGGHKIENDSSESVRLDFDKWFYLI
jgi:hypothetical protein